MEHPQARAALTRAIDRMGDPIETILAQHGVPPRTKLALLQGARPPEHINAIISDIRAYRANGGRLN